MAGPSAADLDKLIAGSNEALKKLKEVKHGHIVETALEQDIESHTTAIKRIEELQKKKNALSWQHRLARYFQKEGSNVFWVVTTGLLFGMAWTRLQEKHLNEAIMREVEEDKKKLHAKTER